MSWFPVALMFGALALTVVEAIRARNLGWAGVACFVLAVIVQAGVFSISD